MKISNKIKVCAFFALIAALSFGAAAWMSLAYFSHNDETRLKTILTASLKSRLLELENYSRAIDNNLQIISEIALVQRALVDFSRAFQQLGTDPGAELRRIYIEENPHPAAARHNLVQADDGSQYSLLHSQYHGWFNKIVQARDFYDLFLIDADGNIVYTVFKESDIGSNLKTGPLLNTALAKVYKKIIQKGPGQLTASDFAPYAPSGDIPAAFEGIPIYLEGRVVGALIVQLRLDPYNNIMQISHDLGATAESYLVNDQYLMLTQSRFIEDSILHQKVQTPSVTKALSGATGFGIIQDYRGDAVLSAYQPFAWTGGQWAVIAEIDVAELDNEANALRFSLFLLGLGVVLGAAVLGWFAAEPENALTRQD